MVEIKFKSASGDKHLALFTNEVASNIQQACSIVNEVETFVSGEIYGIKQADISDISGMTDEDVKEGRSLEDGAYYKGVVKYVSVDEKIAKYTFLVWASTIDEARERIKSLIEQNGLRFAELSKLEKTSYTLVIDQDWIDREYEITAIAIQCNVEHELAEDLWYQGQTFIDNPTAIGMMANVLTPSDKLHIHSCCFCGAVMVKDKDEDKLVCPNCGRSE